MGTVCGQIAQVQTHLEFGLPVLYSRHTYSINLPISEGQYKTAEFEYILYGDSLWTYNSGSDPFRIRSASLLQSTHIQYKFTDF